MMLHLPIISNIRRKHMRIAHLLYHVFGVHQNLKKRGDIQKHSKQTCHLGTNNH